LMLFGERWRAYRVSHREAVCGLARDCATGNLERGVDVGFHIGEAL